MSNNIIANTFNGGFVTKNSGQSHITVDSNPGRPSHITTTVPGMKQGCGIKVSMDISPTGLVGPANFRK